MSELTAIYLAVTIGVFLTCQLARSLDPESGEVATAAAVILLFACLSAVVRMWVPPPWGSAGNPVQDVICVALFYGAYVTGRRRWAAALMVMFVIQLFLHAGYWITGDFGDQARRLYAIKVNAVFCGELATLFLTGGGYVVRNRGRVRGLPVWRAVAGLSRVR